MSVVFMEQIWSYGSYMKYNQVYLISELSEIKYNGRGLGSIQSIILPEGDGFLVY